MTPQPNDSAVPWVGAFSVTNPSECGEPGFIVLEQYDKALFRLHSTVRFTAPDTGLERTRLSPEDIEEIRTVSPAELPSTDLASVPRPLLWLVPRYGAHTPAALIHDRLIGAPAPGAPPRPAGMTDQLTDRYFRFMLEAVGVKWLNRWMMWAAVAFRTRWCASALKKALLSIWLVAACGGIAAAVIGAVTGTWWLVGVAVVAPLVVSLLWQRQYGAGVVAAYTAAWVLPPTILGMIGYWIYLALEEGPVRLLGLNRDAHVRTIGPSASSDRRHPDQPPRARDRSVGPDRSARATT